MSNWPLRCPSYISIISKQWGTLLNEFVAKISGSEFKSCIRGGESRSRHEKSVLKWRLKAAKMQIGSRGLDNGCPAWTTSHTSSLSSSSSSSSFSLPRHHHHLLLFIITTVIMQIGSQGLTSSCPAWSTTHPPTTILTQQEEPPRLISLCTSHLSQQDNLQQLQVERVILQN